MTIANLTNWRKRPLAVLVSDPITDENMQAIAAWCRGTTVENVSNGTKKLIVPTAEGNMEAPSGWRVIRGTLGEFYPCRPDVFADVYEPADLTPVVEIGGQRMTQAQFDAARFPLLHPAGHPILDGIDKAQNQARYRELIDGGLSDAEAREEVWGAETTPAVER